MAKSTAQRQKEFRDRNKGKVKKLEILLPDNEFNLLHDNAKKHGLTKAQYVVSLLHNNTCAYSGVTSLHSEIARLIGCSSKSTATITRAVEKAKKELKIRRKPKNLSVLIKQRIYQHISNNLEDYKILPQGKAGTKEIKQ